MVTGALTRSLGHGDPRLGAKAVRATTALPESVGLISLRDLAWPMAELLGRGPRLNLLSLEALAAARHLDAEICLAAVDENPPLIAAAAEHGIASRVIAS